MVTSLLSLALDKPMKAKTAMTGEITLTGRILKIGGVKEKVIAAKRAGVCTIIMPEANRNDFEDLPDYIKSDIEAVFVNDYEDIKKTVFE
jgi:ATP-dependent Lon protease